jgi:hypothetical protein
MYWSEEVPAKTGKYVVQTKSDVFKTVRTMDASLSFNKKKAVWNFNNQTFYRYLCQ